MKTLIKILLLIVIGLISTGSYLKNTKTERGDLYVGIGVLILAFLLIPLFIYYRYKGKDLTKYSFKNTQEPKD